MAKQFPKIDIFTHILPDKYRKALYKKAQGSLYMEGLENHHNAIPALFDIELRLSTMKGYEGLRQVLTIISPPLEMVANPSDAVELAKMANEEMAGVVAKDPDHFVAGVACLPMNNIEAALK